MVRPALQRIEYPAMRDTITCLPTENTPAPNFWSLDHDDRHRFAQGKSFKLHRIDRTYEPTRQSASATDFYESRGPKMALSDRVIRSPYRYVSMRTNSAGRGTGPYLGVVVGTSQRVGPGAYSPDSLTMPRQSPGTAAFASGLTRDGKTSFAPKDPDDLAYATLRHDVKQRLVHENRQLKGTTFPQTQRWQRPPGPGSNRPADKETPGPGAYSRLHSWPASGFMGTAHGYNHNASL